MYAAWQRAKLSGREPTARQVAEACGASIHTARAALRRFRAGRTPVGKSPGLEPKTVRNVHIMLHAALANAASWRYLVFTWENGRPVHPDVIRQRFSRLAQRCGLPHIRLHDMRHSYTTAALKAAST